jgi:hypothetical protein
MAMTQTSRWTATALIIAVVLAFAAGGVFFAGEKFRKDIVARGARTPAVVTADHDDELDHWYTVSYSARGASRQADLRYPWLIDKFPVGRQLTIFVDREHPERIATEDGYASVAWFSFAGFFGILSIFALFCAAVGRWGGARKRRPLS